MELAFLASNDVEHDLPELELIRRQHKELRGVFLIQGPRRAEPIAQRLIAHKAAVLAALIAPPADHEIRVEDLDMAWRVEWEERAAIMEYDGDLPRERAEALARAAIVREMERAGGPLHGHA